MICSLALDPRFKQLAVQLCGLSRGEDYVWGVVKDAALRHRKFESGHDEIHMHSTKETKNWLGPETKNWLGPGRVSVWLMLGQVAHKYK